MRQSWGGWRLLIGLERVESRVGLLTIGVLGSLCISFASGQRLAHNMSGQTYAWRIGAMGCILNDCELQEMKPRTHCNPSRPPPAIRGT